MFYGFNQSANILVNSPWLKPQKEPIVATSIVIVQACKITLKANFRHHDTVAQLKAQFHHTLN